MAVHYKTQGLVFAKNDRLEADKVFSIFTSDFGRVEIFGKAIRKIASKLKGGIDLFALSDIEFIQGKNIKTLTDAHFVKKFSNLSGDLQKFEIANKIAAIIDIFLKGQEKDEKIWFLVNDVFDKLDNCPSVSGKFIYYFFLWNFFSELGYKPELRACAVCQGILNESSVCFSAEIGGTICGNCAPKNKSAIKTNPDLIKVLRIILEKNWQILSKIKEKEEMSSALAGISQNYLSYLLSAHCREEDSLKCQAFI